MLSSTKISCVLKTEKSLKKSAEEDKDEDEASKEAKISDSAIFKEETNKADELINPEKKALDKFKVLIQDALGKREFSAPPPPPLTTVQEEEKKKKPKAEEKKEEEEKPKVEEKKDDGPKTESCREAPPPAVGPENKVDSPKRKRRPQRKSMKLSSFLPYASGNHFWN
ncbi:patellin-3 [Striga asiatica]|uniref:Patellin-3 n=1 Tax=Striga asiatica TaxID=4170 RepID=A0A5A7PTD1_STRAF|nr:patellin-3 [Striga asiatica]